MIAKRVMILICICLCVMLLISCADGALHAPWTTSSYLPESSSTHETTSGSGENSDKPENNLAAPEVVFVSGNTEYRCGYYEKSTEAKVENGTSAVFCGRAILGGFDRRELIGRIPEVSAKDVTALCSIFIPSRTAKKQTAEKGYRQFQTLSGAEII